MANLGDCSIAWIEKEEIIIPNVALGNWTSQGPLSFGSFNGGPANELFINYTYVAGYANTVTALPALAGATTLTLVDGVGITPGQMLSVYDGMYSEIVVVASTYVFGSEVLPITAPLLNDHLTGTSVSALPQAIKEAAILITTAFLKVRGDSSMTMGVTTLPASSMPGAEKYGDELMLASRLLNSYRRVR